jgi:Cof subfamily protein (haloacid dehalogenase superfamily)
MSDYRIFASDVDDTLLALDGSLPEAARKALNLLHESGITVVLSSGRATASMMPIVRRVIEPADDEYVISFNGGRVVTARSEEVIFEQAIPVTTMAEIMAYCRRENLHMQGYGVDDFVVEAGRWADPEKTAMYAKMAGLPARRTERMEDALPAGTVKMLGIGDHDSLVEHQAALREIVGGQCNIMFSKPTYLEIVSAGVSKGHALAMLSERLGVPLSQCVAMGDSLNDVEMIRAAGIGVAVGNARQELKDAADLVLSRSSDEAAVVEMVEKLFPELAKGL